MLSEYGAGQYDCCFHYVPGIRVNVFRVVIVVVVVVVVILPVSVRRTRAVGLTTAGPVRGVCRTRCFLSRSRSPSGSSNDTEVDGQGRSTTPWLVEWGLKPNGFVQGTDLLCPLENNVETCKFRSVFAHPSPPY